MTADALERFVRKGQAAQRAVDALLEPRRWLVWSMSKRCWWGPDSLGYTNDVREAGRYTDR